MPFPTNYSFMTEAAACPDASRHAASPAAGNTARPDSALLISGISLTVPVAVVQVRILVA